MNKKSFFIVTLLIIPILFGFIIYNDKPFSHVQYITRPVTTLEASPTISETTALIFATDYYRNRETSSDTNQIFTVEKREEILSSLFIEPLLDIQTILIGEEDYVTIENSISSFYITDLEGEMTVSDEFKKNIFVVNIQDGVTENLGFHNFTLIVDAQTKNIIGYTEIKDTDNTLPAIDWLLKDSNHQELTINSSVTTQQASVFNISSNGSNYFLGKINRNNMSAFIFFQDEFKDMIIQLNPTLNIE